MFLLLVHSQHSFPSCFVLFLNRALKQHQHCLLSTFILSEDSCAQWALVLSSSVLSCCPNVQDMQTQTIWEARQLCCGNYLLNRSSAKQNCSGRGFYPNFTKKLESGSGALKPFASVTLLWGKSLNRDCVAKHQHADCTVRHFWKGWNPC